MKKCLSRVWFLLSLQLLFFLYVGLSHQDLRAEEGQPASPNFDYDLFFTKALRHINQKKYFEAIEELNKALAVKPDDLKASYYLGTTLSRVGRNKEAEEFLEKVVEMDPNFQKIHLELGIVQYNLGKYPEAIRELGIAEEADPNNALVFFYQGAAYLSLGDYKRSSPRFLHAATLAPELGLTAHYYAGIGFYYRGILLDAKNEFTEAVRIDPASSVAQSAREFLAQLETPGKKAKRWDLTISTAYQYDSNVTLLAGGSALPAGISRKGDSRFLFYLRGGYRFLETQDWSLGAAYSLYQSLHVELHSFNVQNHQASAFLVYRRPGMQLRIPYEFNFALVGGDTFLRSNAVTPTLTIPESSRTFTELQYGFTSQDFVNTSQFPTNNDRDGINNRVGISQSVVLDQTTRLRVRYDYDNELTGSSATQDDWAYQGHKFTGDLGLSIPRGLNLDIEGYYYLQYYDNPNSSSPSLEKRTDHIQTYTATLSKTFDKWVTLSLQYLYNRNGSNISVFDYDRNIVSVILAGTF